MQCPDITLGPIGILRTPYRDVADNVPIQGRMAPDAQGRIELYPEYAQGCRDLDGFSHLILVYYFHASTEAKLIVKPYMDTETRGVFATRFPHRPNHIGLTLVELVSFDGSTLIVHGVDMVDGTPLLDIKPFCPAFDSPGGAPVRTGWMEKYLNGERTPETVRTANREQWRCGRISPEAGDSRK
jgi:tRNA (adenine37-N6)-methyltransferase